MKRKISIGFRDGTMLDFEADQTNFADGFFAVVMFKDANNNERYHAVLHAIDTISWIEDEDA